MTLIPGDRSQAVAQLQKMLNATGENLFADGVYGDATIAAVHRYQQRVGLVTDGIAGEKTLAALTGGDVAKLLRNATLTAAAHRLGVALATVYAVNEVESAGNGFFSNGKPKILYERHVMYRLLCEPRQPDEDPAALKIRADELTAKIPNLVNPAPGGYIGGVSEYQRLTQAMTIDRDRAREACSWGAFQIMGYHAPRLGYADIDEFVTLMSRSEDDQFEAFARFIEADPALHKALKARRWKDFARSYNGPGYARNFYDVKLQRAYQKYSEIFTETTA